MINQNNQNFKENIIRLIESQSNICDRYIDISRIDQDAGDGVFSLVFKAKDRNSHNNPRKQKEVALKFFNPLVTNQYRRDCFNRESDILKELRGQPNILPLIQERTNFEIILKSNGMEIPLPLMFYSSELANNSIKDYIYSIDSTYLTNIIFFRDICKAVQRIHSKDICHRDLKPGNFLVFGGRYVCLSDFGTARYIGQRARPLLEYYSASPGDTRYAAPELSCGLHFSDKHNCFADIYSLGAILFELFTKTILNSNIFRENEMRELSLYFNNIPERNRIEVFDGFMDGFAKDKELPNVELFDNMIPKVIAHEIDLLYKSLAALDYRNRLLDFQRIFLKINICEKIIKNRIIIQRWRHNY